MHYMHYKDYILHDFYVYSPVLLTQYLGHCWHTSCTELNIWRIRCITFPGLLRKPPLPCHRGGNHLAGGGVWGSLLIYIHHHHFPIISQPFRKSNLPWRRTSSMTLTFLGLLMIVATPTSPTSGSSLRFLGASQHGAHRSLVQPTKIMGKHRKPVGKQWNIWENYGKHVGNGW